MKDELKTIREALEPCPWCGEPMIDATVVEGSTFRWRKVQGCCTDGPEVRHDTLAKDQQAAEADSRTRAIAAWNRRAPRLEAAAVPVSLSAFVAMGDQSRAAVGDQVARDAIAAQQAAYEQARDCPDPHAPPEAELVCYQAYQVVGSLLSDVGAFETEKAMKILDNLSQAKMVHDDVLPWPSFEAPVGEVEPLTDEEIVRIVRKLGWGQSDYDVDEIVEVARAIERAHGIAAPAAKEQAK